jgi:hypothetical protein
MLAPSGRQIASAHFNRPVYDRIYAGPGFTKFWALIAYPSR